MASTRPRATPPRISCFCSSVPKRSTAPAVIMLTEKNPIGICPRANSSHSRHMSTAPPPEPP